jgi:hypothetical protein
MIYEVGILPFEIADDIVTEAVKGMDATKHWMYLFQQDPMLTPINQAPCVILVILENAYSYMALQHDELWSHVTEYIKQNPELIETYQKLREAVNSFVAGYVKEHPEIRCDYLSGQRFIIDTGGADGSV